MVKQRPAGRIPILSALVLLTISALPVSHDVTAVASTVAASGLSVYKTAPFGMAGVNPITNMLYVARLWLPGSAGPGPWLGGPPPGSKVVVGAYDETGSLVANVSAPMGDIEGLQVNPVLNKVYVVDATGGSWLLLVIDGTTNKLADTLALPFGQHLSTDIAVNPNTGMIYVANLDWNDRNYTISVIDGKSDSLVATIMDGCPPSSLSVDSKVNLVYVAHYPLCPLAVIDGRTNGFVRGPDLGPRAPAYLATVNPITGKIYATCGVSYGLIPIRDFICVINGTTQKIIGNVSVGYSPSEIAINQYANIVYVIAEGKNVGNVNFGSNTIYAINGSTDTVIANFTANPSGQVGYMAINPTTNLVYVSGWPVGLVALKGLGAARYSVLTYSKNPITRGSIQTIKVKVNNSQGPLSGVGVTVKVNFASGKTTKVLSCISRADGLCLVPSWRIAGNAIPGRFNVTATVNGTDFHSSFKVLALSRTIVSCVPKVVVAGSSGTVCTVKVTGARAPFSPTGSVRWSASGSGAVSAVSSCTLNNGVCAVTLTGSIAGKVTLIATYTGDPNNNSSSGKAILTIKS